MTDQTKVRDRLQQQYGLKVLRIYLDTSLNEKPIAIFNLRLADGKEVALLTASMQELGLPAHFRIPHHIIFALKSLLADSKPVGAPLWIRLSVPLGLLSSVPWERLLQAHLHIPILRLPYHRIYPAVPTSDIDIVTCFAPPIYGDDLRRRIHLFFEQLPEELAHVVHFHYFADRGLYADLVALSENNAHRVNITVYPPPDKPFPAKQSVFNPWLLWMRDALGDNSADVVHFFCHSYRVRDEGGLALACAPDRYPSDKTASVLFAPELVEFLNQVGAWCVVFSASSGGRSTAGIRMLQNTLARLRPGPSILRDGQDPDSLRALKEAYRFLFTPPHPPPASSALSLYCHPTWVSGGGLDEQTTQQLQDYTLAGRIDEEMSASWLASTQRKLEISAEDLMEATESDPDSGRRSARELVLNSVARYAEQVSSEKKKDEGDRK